MLVKKFICPLLVLPFLSCPLVCAQNIRGKVIDACSKEPVAGVCIRTTAGKGTVTNVDGEFVIGAPSDKLLSLRCLGYKTTQVSTDTLAQTLCLVPIAYEIQPAIAIDQEQLVRKLYSKELAAHEAHKKDKAKARFFFREVNLVSDTCTSLVEAILSANPTQILRNFSLLKGRYAHLPDSMSLSKFRAANTYQICSIPYFSPKSPRKGRTPIFLNPNSLRYYDVRVEAKTANDAEEDLYILHFSPKSGTPEHYAMQGKLHVRQTSLDVVRFEGTAPASWLGWGKKIGLDVSFCIDYDPDGDRNAVVRRVSVAFSFPLANMRGGLDATLSVHALAFRLDSEETILAGSAGKHLSSSGFTDLRHEVSRLEDDPGFWDNNPIVKRTPLEEKALDLFKAKHLVGNYKQ